MTLFEMDRLAVRRFRDEDAPLLFQYSQEACTKEQLPDEVLDSLEDTEERLKFFRENYKSKTYPLVYAVALKDTGLLIGHTGFSSIGGGNIEIEYAIATAHQGKGYASELIKPLAQWALDNLSVRRVYGIVKASNIPSWRCLEKAGFTLLKEETRDFLGARRAVRTYVLP